jgi:mRNA interferase HigB
VHIVTKRKLKEAAAVHPDAESSLRRWQKIVQAAHWNNLIDAQADWPSAETVENLTVFNIAGNKYRLVTYVDYDYGKVFIRQHLLTHGEYDKEAWKNDPWNRF